MPPMYSLRVDKRLNASFVLDRRREEYKKLFDIHWSQDFFDGTIDLPRITFTSFGDWLQHMFTLTFVLPSDMLRCVNNCSGEWGDLYDSAVESRNYHGVKLFERNIAFEVNRRWVIPDGPLRKEQEVQRMRVIVELMWFYHMKRRGRFGLRGPRPLDPSPIVIPRLPAPLSSPAEGPATQDPPPAAQAPPSEDVEMAPHVPSTSSASTSSSSTYNVSQPRSRVLTALDAEMYRQVNEFLPQDDDPSVTSIAARQLRMERRKPRFPHPNEARIPLHLRSPRASPYPVPPPPSPIRAHYTAEENVRRLNEALAPVRQLDHSLHQSALGCIPSTSSTASTSSTKVTVLDSLPTSAEEWMERLGARSAASASHFDILTACLKRALPNQALTSSCQFVADELSAAAVDREHKSLNSLENVADRLRRVIAEELEVRRDALRRRESELVSNWEDEYLAGLREDRKLQAEIALLNGRQPSPSPPPSPRHETPWFGGTGLYATLSVTAASHVCRTFNCYHAKQHSPGSPTPPPPSKSYDYACQYATKVDVSGASDFKGDSSGGGRPDRSGPIIFHDDPPASVGERSDASGLVVFDGDFTSAGGERDIMIPSDPEEPDVDMDKVIASSFYRDLARDLTVDPSIDSAMVRALTSLAEVAPHDLPNTCVDKMLEQGPA
ncbi:hypothetical protein BDZ89DRAFT_1138141 [Hymenopellis radicata]|nr:hypothetical protein BDZ89DRAFT_1138141 [Hymenopellis radicata]